MQVSEGNNIVDANIMVDVMDILFNIIGSKRKIYPICWRNGNGREIIDCMY